jgi:magnesium-transporting ATPase (P-type)
MDEYFVEERSMWDKVLDILVFLAVFAVTIFLILELFAYSGKTGLDLTKVNSIYFYVNVAVFLVFSLDLIRLWNRHDGFKDFMAHCWLDVLATIPFGLIAGGGTAFEVLKLTRVSKIALLSKAQKASRISKISKEFKAASHLKKEGEEYKRKHRL